MKRNVLPLAVVLLGAVLLAGTATAMPTAMDSTLNESDNGTDVGICVVGADSPCNGEEWDGNETSEQSRTTEPVRTDDGKINDSDDVGICVVGADSPCNGGEWDGNGSDDGDLPSERIDHSARANESTDSGTAIGSGGQEAEVGICVIGVDSPCNADRWESLRDTPAGQFLEPVLDSLFSAL